MQKPAAIQHERSLTGLAVPALALVVTIAAIAVFWWWLGRPVPMPATAAPDKLQCMSYAPFRGEQSPLHGGTHIPAAQIEDDLRRLKSLTDCVRTYSMELGLDQVPEIGRRIGMKVIQGLWLSNRPERNRQEIDGVVALANKYPDVIQSIVVGNEVLLRGELSAVDLGNFIREVKSKVPMPVTYADVWEFWQRNRDLQDAVDFVTIHILPYWEDFPIGADEAAAHVLSIREKMGAVFPKKEILIGETGWPSQGRMREGALPSQVNQALILQELLAQAQKRGYRVNVIEAFDQPWKRGLEGTVGGFWGLFDGTTRAPKFEWGKPVSNHPQWRRQAAFGAGFALLVFVAAGLHRTGGASARQWAGVALAAFAGGSMIGLAVERMAIESLHLGGWLHSIALVVLAAALPPLAAIALMRGTGLPAFGDVLSRGRARDLPWPALCLGLLSAALTVLAVQVALGLVFDPRYRDFPYSPLTAAIVPIVLVALLCPAGSDKAAGGRMAERVAGAALCLSAIYIAINESVSNWQSLWFCALIAALGLILLRSRPAVAPG